VTSSTTADPIQISSFRDEHAFLSNGFIEPDGSFVEREYQADKFVDEDVRAELLAYEKPFGHGGVKRRAHAHESAGRRRPDWYQINVACMAKLVWKKFQDWPELREKLLATGEADLVEGNTWHDNFWGDCRCDDADGHHPECLEAGKNTLGQILMMIRAKLRATAMVDDPSA
jgi:ribA/ribD-fused uncharacterized protein